MNHRENKTCDVQKFHKNGPVMCETCSLTPVFWNYTSPPHETLKTTNNNKNVSGLTWSHPLKLTLKKSCYNVLHLASNKWRAGTSGNKHLLKLRCTKECLAGKNLARNRWYPGLSSSLAIRCVAATVKRLRVKRLWEISGRRLMGKSRQEKVLQNHFMAEKHHQNAEGLLRKLQPPAWNHLCWGANVHQRRHHDNTTPSLRNCWFDQRAPLVALIESRPHCPDTHDSLNWFAPNPYASSHAQCWFATSWHFPPPPRHSPNLRQSHPWTKWGKTWPAYPNWQAIESRRKKHPTREGLGSPRPTEDSRHFQWNRLDPW